MKSYVPLILLTLAWPVGAADWATLPAAGTADQYFYDRSKLTIKDDEITYWKKVVFKSMQELHGKDVSSGLLRERIHCAEHTAKLVSYLYYSPAGETVEYVAQDDSDPAPIIPDSVGDAYEKILCPLVWHKQEEMRIKAEQKAATAELAASKKEEKKPEHKPAPAAVSAKPEEKPAPAVPAAPLPMPQLIEQLY